MAKRASEHQITRDEGSDDEDREVKVGMNKADANILAGRQIKGLPKRRGATPLAASTTSSNSSSAAPSPRLSGFTGFGAPPAASTETKPEAPRFAGFGGFGVAPAPAPAPLDKPAETPRFAGFTGFGATAPKTDAPAAENKPTFTGFGSKPATASTSTPFAPTSSSLAPTSSSFVPTSSSLVSASSSLGTTPKPEAPKPESKETSSDTDAALKYWTSLRGLNHAFVESIKQSVGADVFCDLSGGVKQYLEFREKVVREYEDSKKLKAGAKMTEMGSKPVETKPKPVEAKPKSTETKPRPAETQPKLAETKHTFSFGAPSSTASTSSPFTFGAPKPPATSTEPKPSLTMPPNPTIFPSPGALVTPAATPPVIPPSPKKPVPAFHSTEAPLPEPIPTPSPMPEGSAPNVFEVAAKKSVEEKDKPTKPSFAFGTSPFSATSTPLGTTSTPLGTTSTPLGSSTTTKPDAKPFSFSTGNSTPFGGFGGTTSEAPSTTVTPGGTTRQFAFTTPLSTPGTPFAFGAGSPKGNTTAARPSGSVGFSFGGSPPRKETPAFSFGTGASSAVATPKFETAPTTSDDDKDKDKDKPKEEAEAKVDEEPDTDKAQTSGAGEENEDTVFGARARVLRFYNQAWVGVGIGQFKIKYDRETRKRRVLHRLEGTGRVVLNCGLFEEMKPVLESKGLMRFTATDDQGHPMLYRVKVKTEAEAEQLTSSLKESIEAYKADKAA